MMPSQGSLAAARPLQKGFVDSYAIAATGSAGEELFLTILVETFLEFTTERDAPRSPPGTYDFAAVAWAAQHSAELVTRIDQETRSRLNGLVQRGLEEGWTVHEFQEQIQEQDSDLFGRDRALMIARTEGALAANAGETERWSREGVRYVEIIDGDSPDTDEPCRRANGQIWTIDEFRAHPIAHPNCVRRGLPLRDEFIPEEKLGFSIDP